MRVEIRDKEALEALPLTSLLSYLRSHDWVNVGRWGRGRAIMYLREEEEQTYHILTPIRDTLADYAESMAEAVDVISTVEERSQLDVFYELTATGADVIRMRSSSRSSRGALSLRQSVDMLNDAHDLLASAARAVEKPQAAYRGRPSVDVVEYLDSVQPLPGYHEGYALTLYSPVSVGIEAQSDFGDDYHTPFPRLTTQKLARALECTNMAIDEVVAKDSLESFEQAVRFGVSANLCDSVAALAKKGQGIEIDLFWAGVRPSNLPDFQFRFSEKSADILTEAANSFRRNEPSLNESVIAQVVKLEREIKEFDGRAVILHVHEGRPSRLGVKFEKSAFNTVIQAFQERSPISLDGDIYRVGGSYELRNPRNLLLMRDETD